MLEHVNCDDCPFEKLKREEKLGGVSRKGRTETENGPWSWGRVSLRLDVAPKCTGDHVCTSQCERVRPFSLFLLHAGASLCCFDPPTPTHPPPVPLQHLNKNFSSALGYPRLPYVYPLSWLRRQAAVVSRRRHNRANQFLLSYCVFVPL